MLRCVLLMIVCLAGFSVLGQDCGAFQDDARVCFVGDSITHSGNYHSLVYLYYATRFPEKKLHMYNCGIGGDTAAGVLRRFDWDIRPYEPTVVTVMLGMNDSGRTDYRKADVTGEQKKSQAEHIEQYKSNMVMLADKFEDLGCSVFFITPSIYDQTADIDCVNNYGVNDTLKLFGEFDTALSRKTGNCIVDFHNPMRQINEKLQQKYPTKTIVGGDRIHPGRVGNFIMAYLFLTSQGLPEYVSSVAIDVADAKCDALNCDVKGLEVSSKDAGFKCLSKSLPFPVQQDSVDALSMVDFSNSLNKEILAVKGLEAGDYTLMIDGASVGVFSSSELAKGINLALLENTPSYIQALKVANLNEQRRLIEFDLRTILFVEHMMLKRRVTSPIDMDKLRVELEDAMELRENTSTYANYRRKVDLYYAKKPTEAKMRQEIENLIDQMYIDNKPVVHEFLVMKAK